MRVVAAGLVAASVALAGCQAAEPPSAAPASSATASPTAQPDGAALVRAVLEKTRAAATATYVLDVSAALPVGTFTTHVEGAYDLRESRGQLLRTFRGDPPELVTTPGDAGVPAADLAARAVTTEVARYLQMPAWPAPAGQRWLRFDERDLRRLQRSGADVTVEVFPGVLEMLASATAGPQAAPSRGGASYEVLVPAARVFAALPTSTTRLIVEAGLDPAALAGDVTVAVELAGGYVARVSMDAYDLMQDAYARAGLGEGREITGFEVDLRVSGHGKPVRIDVPPAAQVMTAQEFARLVGG